MIKKVLVIHSIVDIDKDLIQWSIYFLTIDTTTHTGTRNISADQLLANELHRLITKKFKKDKMYPSYRHNIWIVDLKDLQLINKYNKRVRFLLCAVNFYSKYTWLLLSKDKKGITITNTFQKKNCMNLVVNQTRYWYIRVVSSKDQWSHGWMIMALKCVQYTMKEIYCCRNIYQNFEEQKTYQ